MNLAAATELRVEAVERSHREVRAWLNRSAACAWRQIHANDDHYVRSRVYLAYSGQRVAGPGQLVSAARGRLATATGNEEGSLDARVAQVKSGLREVGEPVAGRIGDYELLTVLGAGGMGEVLLGHHRHLNRYAALKVMSPDLLAGWPERERFVREARFAASLEHPSILPVYDAGTTSRDDFYIAMKWIPGGSLRDRLEWFGRLPLDQTARIIRQVADALDAAHAAGLVHRDVKPENILLDGDRAYLADFGIARSAEHASSLTAPGVVIGTPSYLAPESVEGATATPATDQYALGCVAYECLTGEAPFTGPALSVMYSHVHRDPPRVASGPLELPYEADGGLQAALAKDPAQRHESCAWFAYNLQVAAARVPSCDVPDQDVMDELRSAVPASLRYELRLLQEAPPDTVAEARAHLEGAAVSRVAVTLFDTAHRASARVRRTASDFELPIRGTTEDPWSLARWNSGQRSGWLVRMQQVMGSFFVWSVDGKRYVCSAWNDHAERDAQTYEWWLVAIGEADGD